MVKTPVLVSERLCFHPWEPEDFPLLAALHRDPQVQHFLQMGDPPWDEVFLQAKFKGFRRITRPVAGPSSRSPTGKGPSSVGRVSGD
jgi:RimJ/RimL family protein N-acetyltransferase